MKQITLIMAMLMWVSQANAHTGSHIEISFASIWQHFASSPYHMGLILAIAVSLAIVIAKIWRSKLRTKKSWQ